MKKFVSTLIILSIISPIWLTNTFVFLKKNHIKKQVKRMIISKIDLKDLVLLKFTFNETQSLLKWEHSKEFEFNGIMYDIIRSESKNDSIFYWCWEDSEETELNKTVIRLTNLFLNDKINGYYVKTSNLLNTMYLHDILIKIKKPFIKGLKLIENNSINYYSFIQKPHTPPPKISQII